MKNVVLSTLIVGALGYPAADTHVVHQKRDATRSIYTRGEPADGKTALPVQIALTQSNLEQGPDHLYDM